MNDKGKMARMVSPEKKCVDTVEEYVPAYPNSNDYDVARQSALQNM